jgi:hypothetical protein
MAIGLECRLTHLACACALLTAARAQALDHRVPGLNWLRLQGAEKCATATSIARRVEQRIAPLEFGPAASADVFVDGYVRRADSGWDVRLEVSMPDGRVCGRRTLHFEGEDCSVIDEAVALVIAVTLYPDTGSLDAGIPLQHTTAGELDALFGSEPSEPDPSSLPVPAAMSGSSQPPTHDAAPPSAASDAPANASAWGVRVDLAGVAGLGQLPGAGFGVAAHAQLIAPDVWPFDFGVSWFASHTVATGGVGSGRGSFGLVLGTVATCPWSPSWFRAFSLCGGAELGVVRAEPAGFVKTAARSQAIVADLMGAGVVRVRVLDELHLRAAALLAIPLLQHRYLYRRDDAGSGEIYRMSAVAVRLEIGAGWSF